ncbi:MAG TPA: GFA family protein [Thermohalobaculum sp.]|nr:GFA family protein [Thermohalobaculum sp.]
MADTRSGGCLCGAVRFTVTGPVTGPTACHCRECQRQSGNYWAAVSAPSDRVEITGPVAWISVSALARRGFCPHCGGFLFWQPADGSSVDMGLGNLDDPAGLALVDHLWCDEATLPVPDDGTPHYRRGRPKPAG